MKLLIRKKRKKKSLDHLKSTPYLKAPSEIHQVPKKGLYDSNARWNQRNHSEHVCSV